MVVRGVESARCFLERGQLIRICLPRKRCFGTTSSPSCSASSSLKSCSSVMSRVQISLLIHDMLQYVMKSPQTFKVLVEAS